MKKYMICNHNNTEYLVGIHATWEGVGIALEYTEDHREAISWETEAEARAVLAFIKTDTAITSPDVVLYTEHIEVV